MTGPSGFWLLSRAISEPEAVISSLQYVAVMGDPIEERGSHLGIAEHAGTFAEAQVGGDDDDLSRWDSSALPEALNR